MNPLNTIIAAIVCALVAGVSGYFWGHAKGESSHVAAISAMTASVESCTVAAQSTNKAVATEAALAKTRDQNMIAAIAETQRLAALRNSARAQTLATPIRGDDECARTRNAIEDHFRRAQP